MTIYYESELYHHGVKGMKWGVRRFQNKDGSLTAKGKKRYANVDPEWMKKETEYFPSQNMLKAMSKKERRDTKRYMKDTWKNNALNNKDAYKQVMRDKDLKQNYKRAKRGKEYVRSEQVAMALRHNRRIYEKRKKAAAWTFSAGVMSLSLASIGIDAWERRK